MHIPTSSAPGQGRAAPREDRPIDGRPGLGTVVKPASFSARRADIRNVRLRQILAYRLPAAGLLSIAHRVSGAALFVALPFLVWLFDQSVSSAASFERLRAAPAAIELGAAGSLARLALWVLSGCYVAHFMAGIRHLWMDVSHRVSKADGHRSAVLAAAAAALVWLAIGAWIFGSR